QTIAPRWMDSGRRRQMSRTEMQRPYWCEHDAGGRSWRISLKAGFACVLERGRIRQVPRVQRRTLPTICGVRSSAVWPAEPLVGSTEHACNGWRSYCTSKRIFNMHGHEYHTAVGRSITI